MEKFINDKPILSSTKLGRFNKMSQPILTVLIERSAVSVDQAPLSRDMGQFEGSHIIDIPRGSGRESYDFMVHSNVSSPDGRTLIQNRGIQYAVAVNDGKLKVVDRKEIDVLPFGVLGVRGYNSDYYHTNPEFVDALESMCR